jgi:hypothetical protein
VVPDILLLGVCGGALVAALFAGLGIWLGLTLTRKRPTTIIKEIPVQPSDPFVADEARVSQLGVTARELEILGLIDRLKQSGDCRSRYSSAKTQ